MSQICAATFAEAPIGGFFDEIFSVRDREAKEKWILLPLASGGLVNTKCSATLQTSQ